jgi:hypothetical protein
MGSTRSPAVRAVEQSASAQLGLFTLEQAQLLGVPSQTLAYHTRPGGRWRRVFPGVHELPRLPPDPNSLGRRARTRTSSFLSPAKEQSSTSNRKGEGAGRLMRVTVDVVPDDGSQAFQAVLELTARQFINQLIFRGDIVECATRPITRPSSSASSDRHGRSERDRCWHGWSVRIATLKATRPRRAAQAVGLPSRSAASRARRR